MNIKALGKIRHNGKDYIPGQIIPGLTQQEYDRLIQLKAGEEIKQSSSNEAQDATQDVTQGTQENNDFTGFQLNGPVVVSVEEFAGLKADEQKAHLKALKIEPAGKEEERIAQYEEWYAEQVSAGGND